MPASELHTDSYLEEIKRIASSLKVELKVIRGEELEKAGFGGLWGVGKAGPFPPALAILSYKPPNAKKTVAFVGKVSSVWLEKLVDKFFYSGNCV